MNSRHLLIGTLLASPLLLAWTLPGEKIRFAPAEGSSATKTFVNTVEMTLDEVVSKVNGAEQPMGEFEMTMSQVLSVTVTDEYEAMGDGQPKKLKRSYDKLTSSADMSMKADMGGQNMDNSMTIGAKTELDGKVVRFTWDAETKEYKKVFEPEEDKPKLLEGLFEDLDLRALLPEGEVKKGESWTVDTRDLVSVLAPGGNLSFEPESSENAQAMGMGSGLSSMNDYLGDMLEGECRVVLEDLVEADGKRVAVMSITLKIDTARDMTELAREQATKAGGAQGMDIELERVDIELEMECKGELRWNLSANCFESFELSGPMKMVVDQAMGLSMGGQDMSIESHIEMSGTNTLSATRK